MSAEHIIEAAVSWMEAAAADASAGYDQQYRWGERGDYDCSSAVITAWEQAGLPVKSRGASYTGNMYRVFLSCGFQDVTEGISLENGLGLKRGDVLLNHKKHTAVYLGGGSTVEASVNELGRASGGLPGDQTGKEFLTRPYRNYPWDAVLRYKAGEARLVQTRLPELRQGDSSPAVAMLQAALRQRGYEPRWIDGDFGPVTGEKLEEFQRDMGLAADRICGSETWAALGGAGA